MPAKPVAALGRLGLAALGLFGGSLAPAPAKPPLPTVLLYPAAPGDVPAMVDLRTRLRLDGQLQALTYDPDSASVKRVAAETSHSEWLIGTLSDDARLALARSLGVAFYAVISPGRESGSTHIQLVQTAPPALTFDWYGNNRQLGARALESQAQAALPPPPADTGSPAAPAPAAVTAAPLVTSSAPAAVTPAPPKLPVTITLLPDATAQKPENAPSAPTTGGVGQEGANTKKGAISSAPTGASIPALSSPAQSASPPPAVTAPPPVTQPQMAVTPPVKPAPLAPVLSAPQTLAGSQAVATLHPVIPAPPQPPKVVPPPPATAPALIGPRIAALPPEEHTLTPPAQEPLTPPAKPMPSQSAPTPDTIAPPKPAPSAADLAAVSSLMSKGDAALDSEDFVGAIAFYRQAINGAPLSLVPRLKLAQAYQKNGMSDKALDEAKRALEIDPNSQPLQAFLTTLDQQNGTSDGTLARFQAAIAHSPDDAAAHAGLAEAFWNSGDLNGAETEYKAAKKLVPPGDHSADAHLAQLYATEARYDDCLAALQSAGKDGYVLALKIVKNRADTLSSTIDAARDAFAGGKSTREQFYDGAKKTSAQAQALAGFVAKVTPPAEYKLSHLHRMLSANLLAQEAATLVAFIEGGDPKQSDSVSQLEKAVQTEMLTAQAAEEKLGLWAGAKPSP